MAAISLGISTATAAEASPELIPELKKTANADDVVCAVAYQDGEYKIVALEKDVPKGAPIVTVYTATKKECASFRRIPSPKEQKRGADINPVQPRKQK